MMRENNFSQKFRLVSSMFSTKPPCSPLTPLGKKGIQLPMKNSETGLQVKQTDYGGNPTLFIEGREKKKIK